MTEHQRDEQRDADDHTVVVFKDGLRRQIRVMADPIGDAWRAQMAHDRERYKSACARADALREELRQLRHEVRLLKDRNAILEARCASLETGLREWLASMPMSFHFTVEHPFAGLRALLDDGLTPSDSAPQKGR